MHDLALVPLGRSSSSEPSVRPPALVEGTRPAPSPATIGKVRSHADRLVDPQHFYVHHAAVGTPLFEHVRKAHPRAVVEVIRHNTHVFDAKHGLVQLAPRAHFKEKKSKVALLHRAARWRPEPNGRSTDFLPTQMAVQGCAFGCTYCYTERHHPNNFPKLYDDALEFVGVVREVLADEAKWQGILRKETHRDFERARDPKHPPYLTFDLGCDSDCVLDNKLTRHAAYPGHVVDIMNRVADLGAMTSFATKSADIDDFVDGCTRPERCRIRLSLMPERHRRVLEMNTSPIQARLASVNRLVDKGFEVHLNLSPVVIVDGWESEYTELLSQIDTTLTARAKEQLAYEVIFLTHASCAAERVAEFAPRAHAMMSEGPLPLVPKPNKPNVLSYPVADKRRLGSQLRSMFAEITPYARVRYLF